MTYQELVTKLIEIQKHMMPDLEKFEREDRLPHDLKVAKAEIIEWEHTVDGDGGLEDAPEIWPVEKFARALRDHYDDFNDFMRRKHRRVRGARRPAARGLRPPARPVGSAAPPATRPASPSPRRRASNASRSIQSRPLSSRAALTGGSRRLRPALPLVSARDLLGHAGHPAASLDALALEVPLTGVEGGAEGQWRPAGTRCGARRKSCSQPRPSSKARARRSAAVCPYSHGPRRCARSPNRRLAGTARKPEPPRKRIPDPRATRSPKTPAALTVTHDRRRRRSAGRRARRRGCPPCGAPGDRPGRPSTPPRTDRPRR